MKLIKHLPKIDICKICGYTGSARYIAIQLDASGSATWNDGRSSNTSQDDQHKSLARLDLQLGLTKYRIHDYRQTKSVNCLVWDRETQNLYFDARADVFALVGNQWQIEEHAE